MKSTLIPVNEAQQRVVSQAQRGKSVVIPLHEARGRTLFSDIRAHMSLPPFNQSNVDGYAIRREDFLYGRALRVVDESAAGSPSSHRLCSGEAIRNFTGAVVPSGADLVVMQELMSRKGEWVRLTKDVPVPMSNIRLKGSHLTKGDTALRASTVLQPAALGLLASLGLSTVRVFRQPRICVIVTGSELQEAGIPLAKGQVYESNAVTLATALGECGFDAPTIVQCPDDPVKLRATCQAAMKSSDVVILSGGISVGDYDYVKSTLDGLRVKTIFYKVQQRPGKPLYYGINASTQVFALPGNPASALTCFYEYVLPCLRIFQGSAQPFLRRMKVQLTHSLKKSHSLTWFLRAVTNGAQVRVLEAQESFTMASYAHANCLVLMKADCYFLDVGEEVEVHLLPSFSGSAHNDTWIPNH